VYNAPEGGYVMIRSQNLRRRRFLQAAAAGAAGSLLSCGSRKGPWRFFTVEESRTVAAIADRIIPADEEPGAVWAGAVNYIDRHLSGHFLKYQQTYRDSLAALDRVSQAMHGRGFSAMPVEHQDDVLAAVEKGSTEPNWKAGEARDFFNLVRDHTLQSFYGDPRHGGNRDAVSWRMIRVPVIPVRGRMQYDLSGWQS
jgi:gluconate 2-dehydrogenase gamma chain